MASYEWPPQGSSGSSGVSSLNTQTGALTLVAGTNITIVPGSGTLTINSTGGGGTGTPDTFAGFDDSGNLFSLPWSIDANGQAVGNTTGTLPIDNVTSLQLNSGIGSPLSGGYEGIINGSTLTSTMSYMSAFNAELNFDSGYNNSGGTAVYQDQSVLASGASTQDYTSYSSSPTLDAGSMVTGQVQGINLNPVLNGTITNNYTGINIVPTGTGSIGSVSGINIDMTGVTAADTEAGGPTAISSNFGSISINASPQLISSQSFQVGNRVEAEFVIPSGSPVTGTDSIGNDFAGDLNAQDDLADGPTAGIVGWTGVGFISELLVGTGKTVDTANMFLAAAALPAPTGSDTDGGTITNLSMIKTAPPLSEGGTISVTNLKALNVSGTFVGSATNVWGLYVQDTGLNNYIGGKLGIGQISPTSRLHLPAVTTAAGSSSLKVPSGTLMTTTEQGAVESDGTNLWWTDSTGTRQSLNGSSGMTLQSTTVNITAVQLNALTATPVSLLSAISGAIIAVQYVDFVYNFVTTPYTIGGANLFVCYTSDVGVFGFSNDTISDIGFLDQSSNVEFMPTHSPSNGYLRNQGLSFSTNDTTILGGDGTVTLTIYYFILN